MHSKQVTHTTQLETRAEFVLIPRKQRKYQSHGVVSPDSDLDVVVHWPH